MKETRVFDAGHHMGVASVVLDKSGSCMAQSLTVRMPILRKCNIFVHAAVRMHVVCARMLVTVGASSGLDMNIHLWDMAAAANPTGAGGTPVVSNPLIRTIEAGPVECWTISLSPDGKTVASGKN